MAGHQGTNGSNIMSDPQQKKRQAKPGTRRVTVTLDEAEYEALAKLATAQMREPNNMLSFMLKDRISAMLGDYGE